MLGVWKLGELAIEMLRCAHIYSTPQVYNRSEEPVAHLRRPASYALTCTYSFVTERTREHEVISYNGIPMARSSFPKLGGSAPSAETPARAVFRTPKNLEDVHEFARFDCFEGSAAPSAPGIALRVLRGTLEPEKGR